MEAICSWILGWLESGYNLASGCAKWIWEEAKSLFSLLGETVKTAFNKLRMKLCYKQQRRWEQSESGTYHETGKDSFEFKFEVNSEETAPEPVPDLPSDPEKRKETMDELKKQCKEGLDICAGFQKYAEDLLKIVEDDEEHQNQQETEQKLKDLSQTENTKKLREALEKQPSVNKSLS